MTQEFTLSANSRRGIGYWRELWRARELLGFLALRNILVHYKQATLGVAWAVLRPLMTTIAFTLVFGKIARMPSGDIPYLILVLSGLAPWLYFSSTITECGNSLISNSSLITKVYFPRLVVPISGVLAGLIDFVITLVLLCILMAWFDIGFGLQILLMPIVIAILVMLAVGLGLWVSALNAMYRDISFIIPFVISFGLYVSPIGFSSSVIPDKWKVLYCLNPIVGIVDGFRFALFGDRYPFEYWTLGFSFLIAVLLIVTGIKYFRMVEREIVDIL